MLGRLAHLLSGRSKSKQVAKERLRLVLMHDRAGLSAELLEAMKEDIVQAISRYVEIDRRAMDVELRQTGEAVALVASIPVRDVRRSPQRSGS
ncbi:MAG TPA: cell division topological specificity factor MinE [Bacillota bacterium]